MQREQMLQENKKKNDGVCVPALLNRVLSVVVFILKGNAVPYGTPGWESVLGFRTDFGHKHTHEPHVCKVGGKLLFSV